MSQSTKVLDEQFNASQIRSEIARLRSHRTAQYNPTAKIPWALNRDCHLDLLASLSLAPRALR